MSLGEKQVRRRRSEERGCSGKGGVATMKAGEKMNNISFLSKKEMQKCKNSLMVGGGRGGGGRDGGEQ